MTKRLPFNYQSKLILLATAIFFSITGFSQSLIFGNENTRMEAGLNIGPLFFLGDLGGHAGKGTHGLKDLNLPLTKVMKGAFLTVYPNDWLGVRAAACIGKLDGNDGIIDTKGVNELWRKQRNLDFRTNLAEGYIAAEIFPLMLLNKNHEDYQPRIRRVGIQGKFWRFARNGDPSNSRGYQAGRKCAGPNRASQIGRASCRERV